MPESSAQNLEQLIRSYISLGKPSRTGFEPCRCADCNDYQERGGFKFEGDTIGFYCFNCAYKTMYESGSPISHKMLNLLVKFGIPADDIKQVTRTFPSLKRQQPTEAEIKQAVAWAPPATVQLPPGIIEEVATGSSTWAAVAREYLKSRALDPASYSYLVTDSPAFQGRVIIPFETRGRVIFWQARSVDDELIKPRYLNPTVDKDKVIFNYDALQDYGNAPIIVTEGALDALSIGSNAIALQGGVMSKWQLNELLKVSSKGKRFIFVIDKNEIGYNLGLKALEQGWSVTVMPDNVDDSNKALQRYGHLWLVNHIMTTAVNGFAGQILLKSKCVIKTTEEKKREKQDHDEDRKTKAFAKLLNDKH